MTEELRQLYLQLTALQQEIKAESQKKIFDKLWTQFTELTTPEELKAEIKSTEKQLADIKAGKIEPPEFKTDMDILREQLPLIVREFVKLELIQLQFNQQQPDTTQGGMYQ